MVENSPRNSIQPLTQLNNYHPLKKFLILSSFCSSLFNHLKSSFFTPKFNLSKHPFQVVDQTTLPRSS
ncbi:hypothetical protein QVD17_15793 [Tagetes erecta]|uniref:Uncharacterized protein n=1 Tax=Tagetes erecta TaxID=13708 RepID=A0AAD8NSZ2_TARER|nr:hypothetical protein QVD17_15793 [Tagetes erecta]